MPPFAVDVSSESHRDTAADDELHSDRQLGQSISSVVAWKYRVIS
jgi:hypothetical protein